MSFFQPIDQRLFFTKNDARDPRLGEFAKSVNTTEQKGYYILGYPDDEGIQLNGGRPGAAQAPDQIRSAFYKMTPPSDLAKAQFNDLGNLDTAKMNLGERHQIARQTIQSLAKAHHKWISLGGGHDYGFADAAGFLSSYKANTSNPIVINFDAHLDVRPDNKGYNSGTPFYRLLNEFQHKFDFLEVGIQPQCNSFYHRQWAEEKGAQVLDMNEISRAGLLSSLQNKLESNKGQVCFLSIDIDAFQNSIAPGCSQSWESGLHWEKFITSFHWLLQNLDVRGIGLYEVSPPLDQDSRTSKLAALIMYHFVYSASLRN